MMNYASGTVLCSVQKRNVRLSYFDWYVATTDQQIQGSFYNLEYSNPMINVPAHE